MWGGEPARLRLGQRQLRMRSREAGNSNGEESSENMKLENVEL